MNYTLVNYKFIEIKEKVGFIENNSGDLIELCITDQSPILNNPDNIYLNNNEKFSYELKNNEKLYGKTVKRVEGCINVFSGKIGGQDPIDAYTKQESDNRYIKKLDNIGANKVKFEDDETLQQKLDNGSLGGGEEGATYTPEVSEDGIISWTNNKGLKNPTPVDITGKTGSIGMNGTPALNNDIYKEGTDIKTKYSGERNLVGIYEYTNGHSTEFDSYPFTRLNNIILKELPNGTANVRVKQLTFGGYTDGGLFVGDNTKNKDTGIQAHLGVLDPSLQTKIPVTGHSVVLQVGLDTKKALEKELVDLKGKYMQQGITKVGSMMIEYDILGAEDRALGSTSIVEYYLDNVTDIPKVLFSLADLKGDKGDKGDSTASIETVTATVDNKVGTPSVEVVLGGTPTTRTIQLNFKNLKGQTGANGQAGAKGETGQKGADGKSAFNEQGQIEYPNGTKEWIA